LNGHETLCLVNTGCDRAILPSGLANGIELEPSIADYSQRMAPLSMFCTTIDVLGTCKIDVKLGPLKIKTEFIVSEYVAEPMPSVEWLSRNKVKWNLPAGEKTIVPDLIIPLVCTYRKRTCRCGCCVESSCG